MSAGGSALEESQRSAKRAETLTRKAAAADARALQFKKGAAGEQRVAQQLAPLTAEGFYVLHDRRAPLTGGNIDHIVIGPTGVLVVDAKHWATARVRDGKLYAGRSSRPEALERAHAMAAEVASALLGTNPGAPVCSALVFVDAEALEPTVLDGVTLLRDAELAAEVRSRPAVLSNAQVEDVLRTLSAALPPFDAPVTFPSHEDLVGPGGKPSADVMEQAYWCYFVTEWRGGSNRRLYLKGETGVQLGWRDARSGEVHLEDSLDKRTRRLAEVLLARIGSGGPDGDAPKVPDWWYGSNPITAPLVTFVVGARWRSGTQDRLYAWLADAKTPRVELGYVDLKTGRLVPSGDDVIPGRVATKTVILGHLARKSMGPLSLGA